MLVVGLTHLPMQSIITILQVLPNESRAERATQDRVVTKQGGVSIAGVVAGHPWVISTQLWLRSSQYLSHIQIILHALLSCLHMYFSPICDSSTVDTQTKRAFLILTSSHFLLHHTAPRFCTSRSRTEDTPSFLPSSPFLSDWAA